MYRMNGRKGLIPGWRARFRLAITAAAMVCLLASPALGQVVLHEGGVLAGSYPSALEISPDGATLYLGDAYGDKIYKMPSSGSAGGALLTTVTAGAFGSPDGLAVSPDGNTIYATISLRGLAPPSRVVSVPASGGSATILNSFTSRPGGLVAFPSSSSIYIAGGQNWGSIYQMPAGGGALTNILASGGTLYIYDVALNQAGDTVFFTAQSSPYLFKVPAAGGARTPITTGVNFVDPVSLALSPDGSTVYILDSNIRIDSSGQVVTSGGYPGAIFSGPAAGGAFTLLYAGGADFGLAGKIALSPDGQTLYFGGTRRGPSGGGVVLSLSTGVPNQPPTANAGDDFAIATADQQSTVIQGSATDPDQEPLQYRWLKDGNDLAGWLTVGANGEAPLGIGTLAALATGDHTFTLEVKDGQGATATDVMVLTVNNTSPYAAVLKGPGTYEVGVPVLLQAEVHDFDGDVVSWTWKEGTTVFGSGSVQTLAGGGAVAIPDVYATGLGVGLHTLTLEVNDGINNPVSLNILVEIKDNQAPVLAPTVNQSILWPPNHRMVDIVIQANATDNSGMPVTLTAAVVSNEPQDGLGDGDTAPDWTEPVIDQATGVITLQLRAERSGKGAGRVYTIAVTATDTSGNASTADVKVIVPHDRRKK